MEQFATQASVELPRRLEHQIFNSKDSRYSNDNLLRLLDLEQPQKKKSSSPAHSVQTHRSDLSTLSPLTEKRKLAHVTEQSNQGISTSALVQLHDENSESFSEAENSEVPQEVLYREKEEYVKSSKKYVNSRNFLAINKNSIQGEHLFDGFLEIPDQYICISRHQKALLDEQDSWFQPEAAFYNSFARIPTKVSKQLISFFDEKKSPQESISNDPRSYQALKSYDQFHQWDYYYNGPQHISSEYFRIPDDQKALLDDSSSWFLGESDPSNRYARIPLEVSQSFISFLNTDVKLEESSQRLEEGCINEIPELVDNSQESNYFFDSNHREDISPTDTKIDHNPKSKSLIVDKCQNNQSVDENISMDVSSNTDEQPGYEPERDLNFVNLDKESYNEDLNAQSISFKTSKEDECGRNYSPTPEPWSRASSIHDPSSDDLRTQGSDNSQSPMSLHTQAENHINDSNIGDLPKDMFYTKFKSIYPEYIGSLRDFTWALVYIEWLMPQDENLDCKFWDDFVRVLASEYTNYIRCCEDPITGLAYYKLKPRNVLFCQNLLSPQTLQSALSSLNKGQVQHYRDAFGNEPKEPAQNSYSAQSTKLNEPQKDLSQKLWGEGRERFTRSIECIDDSLLEEYNDEFTDEQIPVSISHERLENSFQKDHLYRWRQFLRKRKLAGTLKTLNVDKVFQKRHCTMPRN